MNSSVTVPPGGTGSSLNALVSCGALTTAKVSDAGNPTRVAPSTVALGSAVVFR